jgi:hypothetical protein
MTDLERLLSAGPEVRLGKADVQAVAQKLRARGAESKAADRLESQLAEKDEVVIPSGEARQLLEELRASGRRWISGTEELPEQPPPEPEPEPQPKKRRFWQRS